MKKQVVLYQSCVRRFVIDVDADEKMTGFKEGPCGNSVSRKTAEKYMKKTSVEILGTGRWVWAYVDE